MVAAEERAINVAASLFILASNLMEVLYFFRANLLLFSVQIKHSQLFLALMLNERQCLEQALNRNNSRASVTDANDKGDELDRLVRSVSSARV